MNIYSENDRRVCTPGARLRVCYMLSGYPSCAQLPHLLAQAEGGCPDIWEIGYPSPDPRGDGEVIRRAHTRVDQAAARDPAYWRTLRQATGKPIWLMGYYRDLVPTGAWQLLAREGLIDALVIPDCPEPERLKLREPAGELGVDVLGFLSPDQTSQETEQVLQGYALLYVQLYAGPTGSADPPDLSQEMARRACEGGEVLPFAGFGIRTREKIHRLFDLGFSGAIIGTEVIRQLDQSPQHLFRYLAEIGQ